jgi:hypothetical protein
MVPDERVLHPEYLSKLADGCQAGGGRKMQLDLAKRVLLGLPPEGKWQNVDPSAFASERVFMRSAPPENTAAPEFR